MQARKVGHEVVDNNRVLCACANLKVCVCACAYVWVRTWIHLCVQLIGVGLCVPRTYACWFQLTGRKKNAVKAFHIPVWSHPWLCLHYWSATHLKFERGTQPSEHAPLPIPRKGTPHLDEPRAGQVGAVAEVHHGAAAVQGDGGILGQAVDDLNLRGGNRGGRGGQGRASAV